MPEPIPAAAAWRVLAPREGFETLFARRIAGGHLLAGMSAGIEDGAAWGVRYVIGVDEGWRTRNARIEDHAGTLGLAHDGRGGWRVDGRPAPDLDGCLDVDLEASACTNLLPVRRLGLAVGAAAQAPAAYVRAQARRVQRLEQRYERLDETRYAYEAPAFQFAAVLTYDAAGLVVDYPGIAARAA